MREQFPRIEVSEVSNCQQALQQLDSLDLLLLDISLPQENGLQLVAKIKSEHPDLLISILSIHDAPEYRQAAVQHGADYFVSKGSSAEQILRVPANRHRWQVNTQSEARFIILLRILLLQLPLKLVAPSITPRPYHAKHLDLPATAAGWREDATIMNDRLWDLRAASKDAV